MTTLAAESVPSPTGVAVTSPSIIRDADNKTFAKNDSSKKSKAYFSARSLIAGALGFVALTAVYASGRTVGLRGTFQDSQAFTTLQTTCSSVWGQCGGKDWTGSTCCAVGSTCTFQSEWYSQCTPSTTPSTCVADWGQCGGKTYTGATCCAISTSTCSAQSEWYSQCIPAGSSTFPPFTPAPTAATPAPTTILPGCVADWGKCGGIGYSGSTCCSVSTSFCSVQSDWYSQCLPAGSEPFPLVYYPFDDSTDFDSKVARTAISAYNGAISSTGVTLVSGVVGTALAFDDTVNSVVIVGNSAPLDFSASGFTLSAFVYRNSVAGFQGGEDGIITKWYIPDQWMLKFVDNSLQLHVVFNSCTSGPTWRAVVYNIPDTSYLGTWVEVKASYTPSAAGATLKVSFNGIVTSQTFDGCNGIVNPPFAHEIHVGDTNNAWSHFNGRIDEVKIWNAPLF